MKIDEITKGAELICISDDHAFIPKGMRVTVASVDRKPYQVVAAVRFVGFSRHSYIIRVAECFELAGEV